MVRTKGKAAVSNAPPPDKPEVITVPVEEDSSPPSEVTPQTTRKRKQTATNEEKVKATKGSEKKANVKKSDNQEKANTEEEKPYVRGKAALNAYWDELASIVPGGPDVATLKQTVQHLRKVAVVELKKKGAFKVHGLFEMRTRHLKGRAPKKAKCFGKEIEMKAKPPRQRVYGKVPKALSDCVVKGVNT